MFDNELVLQSLMSFDGLPNGQLWNGKMESLFAKMGTEDWSALQLTVSNVSVGWTEPVLALLSDSRCKITALRIDFDKEMLTPVDMDRLVQFVRTPQFQITSLQLDCSKYSSELPCAAFLLLINAITFNKRVQVLRVVCGPGVLRQLARSLEDSAEEDMCGLRILALSAHTYEMEAFRELTHALQDTEISSLLLNLRAFDDIYAQALAQAIPKTQITVLEMNNARRLGPQGSAHMAAMLKQPSNMLTRLKITGGSIGNKGAKAFAEALEREKHCKLQTLDLTHNELGPSGVRRLIKAMRHPDYSLLALEALPGNEVELNGKLWNYFLQTKEDMKVAKKLLALCSGGRDVKRVAVRCSLRRLPQELFRMVGGMFEAPPNCL